MVRLSLSKALSMGEDSKTTAVFEMKTILKACILSLAF